MMVLSNTKKETPVFWKTSLKINRQRSICMNLVLRMGLRRRDAVGHGCALCPTGDGVGDGGWGAGVIGDGVGRAGVIGGFGVGGAGVALLKQVHVPPGQSKAAPHMFVKGFMYEWHQIALGRSVKLVVAQPPFVEVAS